MKKLLFFTLISLLFLSACSSQQKYSSANEAINPLKRTLHKLNHMETRILMVFNLLAIN